MGPEMLLLVGGGEGAGRSGRMLGKDRACGEGAGSGREAMPPITIIFHHPNYIVECASAVACARPVLLLGKEHGTET